MPDFIFSLRKANLVKICLNLLHAAGAGTISLKIDGACNNKFMSENLEASIGYPE